MSRLRPSSLFSLFAAAFMIFAMAPVTGVAQVQGNSFTSAEFGFEVEWTDDWQIANDFVEDYGIGLGSDNSMLVYVEGFAGTVTPQDLVAPQPGDTEVLDDRAGSPARAVYELENGQHVYLESYPIDGGNTTMLISVITQPDVLTDVVEYAREEITLNGSPVITGPALDASSTVETPQPTGQAATQAAGSFTGPVYGYSVTYDPDVWEVGNEINEGNVDGIRLVRDSTTFTLWAWDAYGSDPLVCLDGEVAYYSQEVDAITDWGPALDANGDPLRYESDSLAWGVFNLTYTTESGASGPLIDYISCEPVPGQEATLIVLVSTTPEMYDQELELVLDVLDTLEFADAPSTAGTDEPNTGGAAIEIDTNLSGSEYTSPAYGFTANIPLEWNILDETADSTNETLVVGNGTSEVTLWATEDFSGDLAGCVDFAATASGLDLGLDSDASGGANRGVYRNEAYANFVYEQDGVLMMYYVNCQVIPGTDAFLIVIQDVEYSSFSSERRFRSEIENSIVMPQ